MSSLVKFGWKALAATVLVTGAWSAHAATSVGVSVQISQPGVHGRIDIGEYPQPEVIVARPIVVQPAPRPRHVEPVYLWVPPGHQRNWRRHCREYGACGVPVYFVRDRWYQEHVMPRGQDRDRRDPDRYDDRRGEGRRDAHDDDRRGASYEESRPGDRGRRGRDDDSRHPHGH